MTNSADAFHAQFRRHGFVVLPDLMSPLALERARREVGALVAQAEWGAGFDGTRTRRVWALAARTRCMDEAVLHPLLQELVKREIGTGSQFGLTQATQIHPGQKAQVLHYEQGVYPLPRDREVMLQSIWALDDFTPANGATLVVPGSHQCDGGRPDAAEAIPAEMPAGSVLLMSGRLWHGAGANVADRPRLGALIDFIQPWLRPCEAHTLVADLAEVRGLPERLQELLGFNQATPYFGFIGGRHPREWLGDRNSDSSANRFIDNPAMDSPV